MKIYLRALGAGFVSAGVLAMPAAAAAEPATDTAKVVAVDEYDAAGKPRMYPIHRGEEIPLTLRVANAGAAPTKVVVNVGVVNDLDLPRSSENCWYYVDSNLDGAWCELDQELAAGAAYETSPVRIAATADAKPDRVQTVIHRWFTQDWAEKQGGIEALAKKDSGRGTAPVKGTRDTLRLQPKALTIPADAKWVGFTGVSLITPPGAPTGTPTARPSATASAGAEAPASAGPSFPPSVTATPAAAGAGGSAGDGGLPVTGAKVATVAGGGVALLVLGLAGLLLARRRRNRFVA
ncbi:LPXTG cell wall anchor domain-containing protein [Couchioplanes azureus]|uniref:LPXTG cell wall anchor domain-containing protein n=1 Tax=Couchioplanes caeruleus TaxID=56438 RepID=UPI0016710857|nr:LPXTG cell wall anchor domain-containing protein [Couchioplanes caeruleus]GGQ82176.1 hypothetical protein GCM10010166_60300 [Couchioplanes caeruleus subsp. azureus]